MIENNNIIQNVPNKDNQIKTLFYFFKPISEPRILLYSNKNLICSKKIIIKFIGILELNKNFCYVKKNRQQSPEAGQHRVLAYNSY